MGARSVESTPPARESSYTLTTAGGAGVEESQVA